MLTKKHCVNTMLSTIHAVLGPKASPHNALNVLCPVRSQAFPIKRKVWAEIKAKVTHVTILGIQPVPVALPAASVKIPAPATLLARLKTDVVMDALPVVVEGFLLLLLRMAALVVDLVFLIIKEFDCFKGLPPPPPRGKEEIT